MSRMLIKSQPIQLRAKKICVQQKELLCIEVVLY